MKTDRLRRLIWPAVSAYVAAWLALFVLNQFYVIDLPMVLIMAPLWVPGAALLITLIGVDLLVGPLHRARHRRELRQMRHDTTLWSPR